MHNKKSKSKAILYIRVSGNEKSIESLMSSQEAVLKEHCLKNNIEIVEIIRDNCSAKDFKRPAWKQLLSRLQKQTLEADQLLFTTWDRFSRNTQDAYSMIKILHEMNVFPQAVDQKIDFSNSTHHFLLAIYLAQPLYDSFPRAKVALNRINN